jgi:phospholipase/carboxylesterase
MSAPTGSGGSGRGPRLIARPGPVSDGGLGAGPHRLELVPGPEVVLHVPAGQHDSAPMRLVCILHGAGGNGRAGLAPLLPLAEAYRLLLLAPGSFGSTWDAILGGWGRDARRIDDALAQTFASCPVDPARLAIGGFSDGASYALSLGLANADLFTHVLAFSPGFVVPAPRVGAPQVYISHGRADRVLPIDATTRRIVPRLRGDKVSTVVREFDGPHIVPAEIAEDAVRWFVG